MKDRYSAGSKILTGFFIALCVVWIIPIFEVLINSFKENTWYADSFIKKELVRIFKLLGIKYPKSVTSHTIGDFFEYEDRPTSKQRGKVLHRCKF